MGGSNLGSFNSLFSVGVIRNVAGLCYSEFRLSNLKACHRTRGLTGNMFDYWINCKVFYHLNFKNIDCKESAKDLCIAFLSELLKFK